MTGGRERATASASSPDSRVMIRVFIGYDTREAVAFSVLAYSIHRHASRAGDDHADDAVAARRIFPREHHPLQSTEFSFSRFLTPYLSATTGWACSWTATC